MRATALLPLLSLPLFAPPATAFAQEPAALLEAADEKVEAREYDDAIKLYKQALKAAPRGCAPCQLGLARAYNGVGAHKNAVRAADAAIAAGREDDLVAAAWNQKALAQFSGAGGDAVKLAVAESSFRKVYELAPSPIVRYSLGVTLLKQGRDAEGVAELRAFLDEAPSSDRAKTARDMIEQPRRARETMLPSIELVTLEGEYVTSDDLAGKVVLIDFWGTWCEPCRMAIPSLKALVGRSAEQPLVVISVANDPNEEALKTFIAEHGMGWPQVWDRERRFVREMNVTGYPTYILADHEGRIVFRYSGWGDAVEKAIQSELRRAVGKAKRADKAAPAAP
jgi:thiol-disulfide isomerase/thioredoxin